jgi:hypothetical protein
MYLFIVLLGFYLGNVKTIWAAEYWGNLSHRSGIYCILK